MTTRTWEIIRWVHVQAAMEAMELSDILEEATELIQEEEKEDTPKDNNVEPPKKKKRKKRTWKKKEEFSAELIGLLAASLQKQS